MSIHFIEEDSIASNIISLVIGLAGANFSAPYDPALQPGSVADRNSDTLVQYQLPGGTQVQGYADAASESMGSAINSALAVLAPFISAYGLILPILGIIRGIIEILCCLLNPFCLIAAIIRLFSKWLPPFISLFPPLAGIVIIINLIKAILAVIFFILTVVIPMIELIIHNVEILVSAFGINGGKQQQDAGREKLLALIAELLNQIGVLQALLPIVEIVYLILGLVSGFPCGSGDNSKCKTMDITGVEPTYNCDKTDSRCCADDFCPPIFSNLPKGRAFLLPTFFSDCSQAFQAWKVYTFSGNQNISEIKRYMQNMGKQLECQIDEPVDEAQPAGADDGEDAAHFKIKITGRRGQDQEIVSSIVKLDGNVVTALDPSLLPLMGYVDYEIVPNWPMLIARGIVGLGCHPEVSRVKQAIKDRFADLEQSALERLPELANFKIDLDNTVNQLNGKINDLRNETLGIAYDLNVYDINNLPPIPESNPASPPYNLKPFRDLETEISDLLLGFVDRTKDTLGSVLTKIVDLLNSVLDVDKHLVKVGDKAIISVIPKDSTGSLLLQNLPQGVDISVSISTNFGVLGDQVTNNETGVVNAELTSQFPGEATVTAKINSDYILEMSDFVKRTKSVKVKFVSDAILPKRRLVSKPRILSTKRGTAGSAEKEPGRR